MKNSGLGAYVLLLCYVIDDRGHVHGRYGVHPYVAWRVATRWSVSEAKANPSAEHRRLMAVYFGGSILPG